MGLVGCFVTPHPPIIIPEVGGPSLAEAEPTVRAMTAVRERAAQLAPDTIVLLSPHSPLARSQMGVSLAASYKGSLAYFRAPQVRVEAAADVGLAEAIMQAGRGAWDPGDTDSRQRRSLRPRPRSHGAPGLSHRSPEEPLPAGAALVLLPQLGGACPLWAGHRRGAHEGGAADSLRGEQRPQPPAHPRGARGLRPPGRPVRPGRSPTPSASGDWDALLTIDPALVSAAGECGYRSLAVLSGVVGAYEASGGRTHNRLLSYEGPWGVGYLVGEVELTAPPAEEGVRS